ncbi:MAG: cation:proton antiporter, partial [Euryarchaeota archaeon]|nr:cation:proton antiporter [Euryarchaeota archaeon]
MALTSTILQDLAVVFALALGAGLVFSRLRQSAVMAYLVVGALIGPASLRWVSNTEVVALLADLGVTLLMFSVGLEFSFSKFRRVGFAALFATLFKMLLMVALGNAAGGLLGWSPLESLYLGAALSISSTTIIVKILRDMGQLEHRHGQLILGILIVEDLAAVVLLALLGSASLIGRFYLGEVVSTVLGVLFFFFMVLLLGLRFYPRFLDRVHEQFHSRELTMLGALGFGLGLALLSGRGGFSAALGAFLAGMIVSEARCREEVHRTLGPLRDLFAILFFVSVGMLVDPRVLGGHLPTVALLTLLTVGGRLATNSLGLYLTGQGGATALAAGMGLVGIGEFSFVIARQGADLGVTRPFLYPLIVSVAVATTFLTPPFIRASPRLVSEIDRRAPRRVKNFFGALTSWLTLFAGAARRDREVTRVLSRKFLDILANTLIIIAIWTVARSISTYLTGTPLGELFDRITPPWMDVARLALLLALVLTLPSAILILRRMREMTDYSLQVLGQHAPPFANPTVHASIQTTVSLSMALVLLLAFAPVALQELGGDGGILPGLALLTLAILLGVLFWNTIRRFQGDLEETVRDTLLTPARPDPNPPAEDVHRRGRVSS